MNTDERGLDEGIYLVTPRQKAQYESTESLVELFGQFDQGVGPDGAHYVAESPFAGEGLACSSCVFYEGPRACEVVSGDIDPAGICKLWVIPGDLVADPAPVEGEPVVDDEPMDVPMEANAGDGGDYHRTSGGVTVPDREVRHISRLELRTDDATGLPVLEGYATVYDYAYDIGGGPDNGGFTEVIARGATAKSAQEADVRLLANHSGLPLARTRSGSMTLESDDIGLRVRALLDPANPAAAEVISGMNRGDIDQMSFAFKVVRDSWSADYNKRTISEVRLFDVSVVTYPANEMALAKLRADNDGETETVAAKSGGGRSIELARRQLVAEVSRKR
jgi:HK97 family phage prohead protease